MQIFTLRETVIFSVAAAVTQLPIGGAQIENDLSTQRSVIQTFHPGLTSGDMNMIGHTTQYDCILRVTGDAQTCAVNFQPAGVDQLGAVVGACVAVSHCGPSTSTPTNDGESGMSGVLTAPVNVRTAPSPPPEEVGACSNGLPPPCSGPLHDTFDNVCEELRAYADGATDGTEELIAHGISKADCVTGQDWSGSPYCAVNFYPDVESANPRGRCMGVLPPCGATVPSSEADTAALPIDQTQPCTWTYTEPTPPPPSPPVTPPPAPLEPPPVIGVPIGQHSLMCADGSLQVCADGSQHRAVFCRADLDYTLGPAATGAACAKDHQAACSCECCTCADGLLPACQGEIELQPDTCDDTQISALFSDINDICCAGVDCTNGPPASCNQRCAGVITDAWQNSACQTMLQAIMGDTISSFVELCEHPGDEVYTDADDEYVCSYTELINLVLECTVAEEHDCSSTCVVHMRPFLQQCGEVMHDMISAMEPAEESFQAMVARCDAPVDTKSVSQFTPVQTCDISNILATCSHLDEDLASATSMDALCVTPCVHLVVDSFDACNSDPSQEVRQQFGAEQWQPVVLQCQQLASAAPTSTDDHCINAMETILASVNQACCVSGCKTGPPKSCSSSCADAFMPVRHLAPLLHERRMSD